MKKFFVAVSLLGILSCSKSGDGPADPGGNPEPIPDPGNTELTITTITPNSAERVPVTITGTGFNTTPAQNTVHFSGLPGVVTAATATTLTVTLPDNLNAGDHDVRVGAKGKNATKVKGFHLVGWIVSNFAGVGPTGTGQVDGAADVATFAQPVGMVVDNAGNFFVADQHKIRMITPQGVVSTFAGANAAGDVDANGANARFRFITSLAIDAANNLYVADNFNHTIRKVTPGKEVTTIAGKAQIAGDLDGVGDAARFAFPYGVTVDPTGQFLYVSDNGNDVIRRINLATKEVVVVAGNGTRTRKDDNGVLAGIPGPGNLAFDADGNLIITEKGAGMIRKMTAGGAVTTIGGFNAQQDVNIMPTHLTFDNAKNIYVSFSGGREIRKYATDGSSALFAGAWVGPDEEFGAANVVQFGSPAGIVLKTDAQGNKVIYVADTNKKRIKKITKE